MIYQLSDNRVRMHVVELLANFLFTPDVEVIESRNRETGKPGTKPGTDGTFSDTYLLRLVRFAIRIFRKGELPVYPHLSKNSRIHNNQFWR
jgi:hypothetical protein